MGITPIEIYPAQLKGMEQTTTCIRSESNEILINLSGSDRYTTSCSVRISSQNPLKNKIISGYKIKIKGLNQYRNPFSIIFPFITPD